MKNSSLRFEYLAQRIGKSSDSSGENGFEYSYTFKLLAKVNSFIYTKVSIFTSSYYSPMFWNDS